MRTVQRERSCHFSRCVRRFSPSPALRYRSRVTDTRRTSERPVITVTIGSQAARWKRLASMTTVESNHLDGNRFFNPTGMNASHSGSAADAARAASAVAGADRRSAAAAAGARRRWRRRHVHRPCDVPDSDGRRQYPDRPDVIPARRSARLLGPRRVRQPAVRFDDLPPISTVLLSHNHYDHCDLQTLRGWQRFDPLVVTPLGNGRWCARRASAVSRSSIGGRTRRMRSAESRDAGATFFGANAVRSEPRALGWLWSGRRLALYFAGDTAYARVLPGDPAGSADRPGAAADRRV